MVIACGTTEPKVIVYDGMTYVSTEFRATGDGLSLVFPGDPPCPSRVDWPTRQLAQNTNPIVWLSIDAT